MIHRVFYHLSRWDTDSYERQKRVNKCMLGKGHAYLIIYAEYFLQWIGLTCLSHLYNITFIDGRIKYKNRTGRFLRPAVMTLKMPNLCINHLKQVISLYICPLNLAVVNIKSMYEFLLTLKHKRQSFVIKRIYKKVKQVYLLITFVFLSLCGNSFSGNLQVFTSFVSA